MNDEAQHQIDLDMERMAMTDADGMDHPYATGSGWERGDYYGADRRRPVPTRIQLQAEARRHEDKLRRVRERIAALENIPETDPYENGTVLWFKRGQYTYAALRVNAFWYTTGRHEGVNRVPWTQFIDWMLQGRVGLVHEMVKGESYRFGAEEPLAHKPFFPARECTVLAVHKPHVWFYEEQTPAGASGPWTQVYCRGITDLTAALLHQRPVRRCGFENYHPGHAWVHNSDPTLVSADEDVWCPGVTLVEEMVDRSVAHPQPSAREQDLREQVANATENLAALAKQVSLWRSVATYPIKASTHASGSIHVACGLQEPHGGHLYTGSGGSLVGCEGMDAPEKQD